jgi:Ca2+:H+ antiporter
MLLIATMTIYFVVNSGRSALYLGVMLLMVYATLAIALYLPPPAA